MKYVYPAIFTQEGDLYSVTFPDFENSRIRCYTSGDSLTNAYEMAEDVLAFVLYEFELAGDILPTITDIKDIEIDKDSIVSLVYCNTDIYRRQKDSKAVKKTLSIPSWLNSEAEKAGVNFSQILQDGIKEKLGL